MLFFANNKQTTHPDDKYFSYILQCSPFDYSCCSDALLICSYTSFACPCFDSCLCGGGVSLSLHQVVLLKPRVVTQQFGVSELEVFPHLAEAYKVKKVSSNNNKKINIQFYKFKISANLCDYYKCSLILCFKGQETN